MSGLKLSIDEELCWGCKTCEAACRQENGKRSETRLITVRPGPVASGSDGRQSFRYEVKRCLHCDEPECVPACAVDALAKRPDGIVTLDRSACVGCGACVLACPYEAVELDSSGLAAKCDLCAWRIDRGLYPACADNVCLAHCITLKDR